MSDEQHRELAARLQLVKGMVVLSGYPSALYDELYAGWHRVEKPALADGARPRTEVLWLNASAQAGLEAQRAQGGLFSTQAADDRKITTAESHDAFSALT
jgi:DNA adenine methylase